MALDRPEALVIEDSPEITMLVRGLLEREGYAVVATPRGDQGLDWARAKRPELVILDLSLPDRDGVDVCRELRGFSDAYVVMVTARDDEVDKIVGLTVGADDYVTKPFSPRELAARVRAMRRRPRIAPQQELRDFGHLVVDPVAREVVVDGDQVELTKIEFDILDLLSGSPRRTFTREQLLVQVWGEWFGDDHVIEVHMGKLRKKLGESASQPRHIRTLRGVGYRFEPA
ncbi:MAG: response regulator [Frankiales bacterium]|nr:response regulator [Frankiales bacterium]